MFRKLLLGAALLAALMTGAAGARAATLKFGVAAEPYPPFTTQEASGKWVGFEVELMDAICKAEDLQCEMVGTSWDGLIPSLNAKKIDVIWSSMTITDQRKKVISFTNKYYVTPTAIIAAKSLKLPGLSLTDFSALKGKTIGVQTSTIHANLVQKHMSNLVTLKTYDSQDNANADLASGRLDAVVADSVTLDAFLKSDQGQDYEVKLLIPNAFDPDVLGEGVGGGLRKSDTELKAKLDAGIAKIRADGTYDQIAKKYFNFDIYGS